VINFVIKLSVNDSLKPGIAAGLLSSAIGIAIVFKCAGTEAPVNE